MDRTDLCVLMQAKKWNAQTRALVGGTFAPAFCTFAPHMVK